MPRWRRWPRPFDNAEGSLHLIGDTEFGTEAMNAARLAIWEEDLGRVPDVKFHVMVGDLVDEALPSQDTQALAFMNANVGAVNVDWAAAVGNHDALRGTLLGNRSMDEAAIAWGQPAANFVVDLDFCRLIYIAPDGHGATPDPFTSDRLNWINAQLLAAGGTQCVIVCHWPIQDTAGVGGPAPDVQYKSDDPFFYAHETSDIVELFADNANATTWLSGHTHSPIRAPQLVCGVDVGPRVITAVNASAIAYTGQNKTVQTHLHSMFATVYEDRVEVRFRDHGAGVWCGAGPDRQFRWSA